MIDKLKRLLVFEDLLYWENGVLASPFRQVVACALFDNPWLGFAPDADLSAEIEQLAPGLGKGLAEECVRRLGGADGVACIGKGSLVGLSGEIEHANVLIHTRLFGNDVRSASNSTCARLPKTLCHTLAQPKSIEVRQCQRSFDQMGFRPRKSRSQVAQFDPVKVAAFKKTASAGKAQGR